MADWKYNPDNYNPDGYELIPPGDYRVRIEDCEEKLTQTGKDMYKLTLAVSGYSAHIWYYLVFDNTDEKSRKYTDQRLGSIFDSFNIPRGNINPSDWKGKTGGARIKNNTYKGEMRAELHYFLKRKKVDELPAWKEGSTLQPATTTDFNTNDFSTSDFSPEAIDTEKGFDDTSGMKIPF